MGKSGNVAPAHTSNRFQVRSDCGTLLQLKNACFLLSASSPAWTVFSSPDHVLFLSNCTAQFVSELSAVTVSCTDFISTHLSLLTHSWFDTARRQVGTFIGRRWASYECSIVAVCRLCIVSSFYTYVVAYDLDLEPPFRSNGKVEVASMRTASTDLCLDRFFWATRFLILFLFFPYFFVSGPCARLSWPSRQLLCSR